MNKLLSSNFRRLLKNKAFWSGLILVCAISLICVFNNHSYRASLAPQYASSVTADATLLPGAPVVVVVMAVLVSTFVGREYSDKTIRNKIISGHSRTSIYLANLIVCSIAAIIIYLVPTITIGVAIGMPLFGGLTLAPTAFIMPVICNLLAIIAFVAIFLMVVMLLPNRTISSISVLLLALIMFIIPSILNSRLDAPEYIQPLGYVDDSNNVVSPDYLVKNPSYLSGISRKACEFLYNFLPSGQINQIVPDNPPKHIATFPVYSLVFIIAATAGGLVIFKCKDIQ